MRGVTTMQGTTMQGTTMQGTTMQGAEASSDSSSYCQLAYGGEVVIAGGGGAGWGM